MTKGIFGFCFTCIILSSCMYESAEPEKIPVTDSSVSYSKKIAPIVSAQCNSTGCHESGAQFGDFTMYDGLKEKASDGSLLNRVVKVKDMPQLGSGFTLTDEERGYFAAWIQQGFPNN
jgi:hypothetical protein